MNDILKDLNKQQKKAATTFYGPMLILAGAGSGKTKTLITRTANMILNGILGESILTLTFTNKAAKEMQERGMSMLESLDDNVGYSMPEFTTFHSWCLKFIRNTISYCDELHSQFTIADDNVSGSVLTDIIKEVYGTKTETEIKSDNLSAIFSILSNNLISYEKEDQTSDEIFEMIEDYKSKGKSLNFFTDNLVNLNFREIKLLSISYVKYKAILRKNNLADFDDLINLSIKIMSKNKEIRSALHNRYKFIMVDEFQDTNLAQIKLLELICNKDNNICVVGDDSQSIYGWRGADIAYILNFHKLYKDTTVINLTKNYRSTSNILSKANKLLDSAEEKHSLKESLKAFRKDKGNIFCSQLFNDGAEAQYVAKEVSKLLRKGVNPNEIAILYRSNYLVRSFEKELIKEHIPYQIFKGRSILQKKSVIELMALVQYIVNGKNLVSLEMFLCSTTKIISQKKMEEIKEYASNQKMTLEEFFFSDYDIKEVKLTKTVKEKLNLFFAFVKEFRAMIETSSMQELSMFILNHGFIFQEYERIVQTSKSEKTVKSAETALNDLHLILSLMQEYENMDIFLEDVILSSETEDSQTDKINLMTIHASKGLEFEYVFLVRFNNEIFPTKRALVQPELIEEERRLAYVAITRAKVFLSVSYIDKGFNGPMAPSRFLRESGLLKLSKPVSIYRTF